MQKYENESSSKDMKDIEDPFVNKYYALKYYLNVIRPNQFNLYLQFKNNDSNKFAQYDINDLNHNEDVLNHKDKSINENHTN